MSYDLRAIEAPRVSGAKLLFLAWLLEHRWSGRLLAPSFLSRLGVNEFRLRRPAEAPTWYPIPAPPVPESLDASTRNAADRDASPPDFEILSRIGTTKRPEESFVFPSIADYARAYRDGALDPRTVAERIVHILEHQDRGNPPLYAFISYDVAEIRRAAADSAERFANGSARSIFEGVPVAVKDEIDVAGFATTLGTSFHTLENAESDAWIVAKLREAGAIILGKTNMHEIGIGVTGLNPFYGTPINPYAPWRYPGGSSSGSASVVASGICPTAIGADGGGSVRIPAA